MHQLGGIRSPRPLRPLDLNHVGIFYDDEDKAVDFYGRVLGFSFTDVIPKVRAMFMRMNTEHHSISFFSVKRRRSFDDTLMQHAAWEIGTYEEILFAIKFLKENGIKPELVARRMPGSNYTVYFLDPEDNRIELAYGMESVGWQGRPKPFELWKKTQIYDKLPRQVESLQRETGRLKLDLGPTSRRQSSWTEDPPVGPRQKPAKESRDASGEISGRPFKISKLGYYALRCRNLAAMSRFYQRVMGLTLLRQTSRSVALVAPGGSYPDLILETGLGQSETTARLASVCFEVRSYSELMNCLRYLKSKHVEITGEGRSRVVGTNDQYCIDFRDPYGNPIRLGFSPKLRGLQERRKSKAAGLPDALTCS